MSTQFGLTLRTAPGKTEAEGHQMLVRAGFVRQLGQGIFSYLPLGWRSVRKIENILRQEMDAVGGQELSLPVVHPAEIWKASGRYHTVGPELTRFHDRRGRDMVLAMTHEEVIAELCQSEISSYRDLPRLVYQIQTKFRDDPRPRAGLIRTREFTMKDSYSLDRDAEGLERQYQAHYDAYFRIFERCGLPVNAVGADVGMMGGSGAHEFMFLTPIGEDTLVLCDGCGYAANRQVAVFAKPPAASEAPLPLERVHTPGSTSIQALTQFVGVPATRTAKAVFMMAELNEGWRLVLAMVRGDLDVNETKLANAVHARELRPATEEEIAGAGAAAGYASPLGLHDALVVVDDSVASSPNLVSGANEAGWHLRNTNLGRDYLADMVVDIAVARDGDACATCGATLRTERAVEVGNIFKLGTKYSQAFGARFLDEDGVERPIVMGSYGIGLGRTLACIAEAHHDERGLIWPASVAPFDVHLVRLRGGEEVADRAYAALTAGGVEVLYDDRDEAPGVQFADADLIGLPLRLTASTRSLSAGGLELRLRANGETRILAEERLADTIKSELMKYQP
jgi:prolyl-tRNA synthetase